MEEIKPTPRTTVNRMRKRGSYDREVIHAILDRSLVCHVGVVIEGAPRVLPTLHARIGDSAFLSTARPATGCFAPPPKASRCA